MKESNGKDAGKMGVHGHSEPLIREVVQSFWRLLCKCLQRSNLEEVVMSACVKIDAFKLDVGGDATLAFSYFF